MLHKIIQIKKNQWLQSQDCTILGLVNYIRDKGQLRDTQIEAIETYLFLKIKGENKPLWQLFSEGFFTNGTDLSVLNINQIAREHLSTHKNAFALYDFAKQQKIEGLEKEIISSPATIDYDAIIKSIFYNVNYSDYLMSLPMGAGKTFLMAAFIYLDLYFAEKEPTNKAFAHNFLVLIPSGLKSSIVPSLKSIINFNPSWVLPEPYASNLRSVLQFDVLDVQKTAKKSGLVRNPNAQKVNACLPNPFGHVFVVNAEKVILESFKFNAQTELQLEEEKDTTNDLKRLFGLIPNLSILIDEVHHAATDDVKLRQAVNYWQNKGNITTVLGFSGTPYLPSAETIKVGEFSFKFSQITNTVYYYPLITAIKQFLKTPTVKIGDNMDRFQIIKNGIEDFNSLYKTKVYNSGAIAKIAIYCSNIEILEEQIYPFLTDEMGINPTEILKYHGGNKTYSIPKENELEFRSLDLAISKKRYILLVQVGKEGWDCPSLTGIILSQKGDSPQNMVLQTSCRCLRQVDSNRDAVETALIWLNKDNADTLNKQLKLEQNSSIDELNNTKRGGNANLIARHSRMDYLELPLVDFYQMKVSYTTNAIEKEANTEEKLTALIDSIDNYKTYSSTITSGINDIGNGDIEFVDETGIAIANYHQWIFEISRQSFGFITHQQLHNYDLHLSNIFASITYIKDGQKLFNSLFDIESIQSQIRLAFSIKRTLLNDSEIIRKDAELLIASNLHPVEFNNKLYPDNQKDIERILELDKTNEPTTVVDEETLKAEYQKMIDAGFQKFFPRFEDFKASQADKDSPTIKVKNNTFHYIPYNFGSSGSSGFELSILQNTLRLPIVKEKQLEIYYNGDNHLTNFKIDCFSKNTTNHWNKVGQYTTDFLIIERKEKAKINRVLMIETKGEGFSHNPDFLKRKHFVETEFLRINQEKFGYKRFDFLYIEDRKDDKASLAQLNKRINEFFND